MIIAVDFDGTLVDHIFPDIGPSVPRAFKTLCELQASRNQLILWTIRAGIYLSNAVEHCKIAGIEFWGVNENPDQKSWSGSSKAYAALYIDDAAFGCPLIHPKGFQRPCVDWEVVHSYLLVKGVI